MLESTRKKILAENEKIQTFIKEWQSENPYSPEIKKERNAKFRVDFNKFLDQSNFSESTKKLFKN